MSSQKLIVSELLAFLQYQLGVTDEVSVMQICTSNFNEAEIRRSKALLYESLDIADKMPSRRRDEKGEKSLQDIIKVLKEIDPDNVPTFVDVTRLLKDVTILKASLAEVMLKLEASQTIISELHTEMVVLRNTVAVSGSTEASNVNMRRGADSASPPNCKSAKSDSPPADVTRSNALPCPPRLTSAVAEVTSGISTSTPRAYAAAARLPPVQYERPKQTTIVGVGAQKSRAQNIVPIMHQSLNRGKADEDGFIKVENKRKRKPTSRNQCGTALTGANMLLRPAIPSTQLYVSRLHHSTKVEEIVEYILIKTNWTLRVEKLESRHNVNFKSFVVRVPTKHLDTFLKEEFWPKGVVYRRFRGRLRDTTQRNTTPTLRVH